MKINLKIKDGNTTQTEQYEIEEINILQMTRAIKVVKNVLDIVRKDEHLQSVLEEIFSEANQEDGEEKSAEEFFTQDFAGNIVGALDVLLMEVPEKIFELMSVLSGIDYEVFMQQKPDEVFDIYDAILEVNDIEKLVKRAKKSFRLTKAQKDIMNLLRKKPKEVPEQPQSKLSSSNSPAS